MGVSGKELARLCGVADNTIYRIEGRTKSEAAIYEKSLLTICGKLGIDSEWFLDFDRASVDAVGIVKWSGTAGTQGRSVTTLTGQFGVVNGGADTEGTVGTPGSRVKQLRAEMGLSQTDFSKLVGIGRANLASIEIGRNHLTEGTAKVIENACEHGGAEWLLTGNERNRHYPLNDEMKEWLMEHPDTRKKIWEQMKGEDDA